MGRGWRTRGRSLDRRYRDIREAKGLPFGSSSRRPPTTQEIAEQRRRSRSLFNTDTVLGQMGIVQALVGTRTLDQLRSLAREYVRETNPARQTELRNQMSDLIRDRDTFRNTIRGLDNVKIPEGYNDTAARKRYQSLRADGIEVRGAGTKEARAAIERVLGKDVGVKDLVDAMKLPPGVRVEFQPSATGDLRVLIRDNTKSGNYGTTDFTISGRGNQKIANVGLVLPKTQGGLNRSGVSANMDRVINVLQKAGVSRIETTGAMGGAFTGARAWPLIGMNAPLTKSYISNILKPALASNTTLSKREKADIAKVTTIQGLIRTKFGKRLWAETAYQTRMSMNIKPGSGDMKNFNRNIKPTLERARKPLTERLEEAARGR